MFKILRKNQDVADRQTKNYKGTESAPSPYFSTINVHLVNINAFAKFDETPPLPVQDIKEHL